MENKEVMRIGEILEGGVSTEFWKEESGYIREQLAIVSEALVKSDFDEMKQVYFLKGQVIGLAKALSFPKKTIKRWKELVEKAEEKAKKKKKKGK